MDLWEPILPNSSHHLISAYKSLCFRELLSLTVVKNQRMDNTQVWDGLYIFEAVGKTQIDKWCISLWGSLHMATVPPGGIIYKIDIITGALVWGHLIPHPAHRLQVKRWEAHLRKQTNFLHLNARKLNTPSPISVFTVRKFTRKRAAMQTFLDRFL